MNIDMYSFLFNHIFSKFDAETIHNISLKCLQYADKLPYFNKALTKICQPNDNNLQIEILGHIFPHPLGLAAGFDKNANCISGLHAMGFSFLEVGTVTPYAQNGNSFPRISRLKNDNALVNSMGFPNDGSMKIASNIKKSLYPIFCSIGKNKDTPLENAIDDYNMCIKNLHKHVDFFVINVSSPNTLNLRKLQTRDNLFEIFKNINKIKPLLIKISPDLTFSEIDDIIELVQINKISGIIATNTMLHKNGGLSGKPLQKMSTDIIRHIYKQTKGQIIIIGTGGIFTGEDIWEKMCAGANLVQAYTGFIYRGPLFVKKAIQELQIKMKQECVNNLKDIIGIGMKGL